VTRVLRASCAQISYSGVSERQQLPFIEPCNGRDGRETSGP
jgi:hypothetical protein